MAANGGANPEQILLGIQGAIQGIENRLGILETGVGVGGTITNQILGQVEQHSNPKVTQLEGLLADVTRIQGDMTARINGLHENLQTLRSEVDKVEIARQVEEGRINQLFDTLKEGDKKFGKFETENNTKMETLKRLCSTVEGKMEAEEKGVWARIREIEDRMEEQKQRGTLGGGGGGKKFGAWDKPILESKAIGNLHDLEGSEKGG